MTNPIEFKAVTKQFGEVVALDAVDLHVRPNEILGLIGQNGSGKSTLMRMIAGVHRPTSGKMLLHGRDIVLQSPLDASRRGIGMVHQEQSLIPNLTVAENIFLGTPGQTGRFGVYNWTALYRKAQAHLDRLEFDIPARALVENLTFAQRQMVELAKVLSLENSTTEDLTVLFDEATAIMSRADIEMLFGHIRRIKARASVIFISHRMDEVLEISDRIYVLSDGKVVAERAKHETRADQLYDLMVGSQRAARKGAASAVAARRDRPEKLRLANISSMPALKPTSLKIGQGEILGLIGVNGSGAEELCRIIFGAEDHARGEIFLDGRKVHIDSPRTAVRSEIGYVPAERKLEGAVLGRSVAENMCLALGGGLARGGMLIDAARESTLVKTWFGRLNIKAQRPDVAMSTLSGGNQQKAVLGKWLITSGISLLVLDHPTRGLDPGARADLFAIIRELASDGLSVLFVADTLDEILLLADRILVMRDGEISAAFDDVQTQPPLEEDLVRAMV